MNRSIESSLNLSSLTIQNIEHIFIHLRIFKKVKINAKLFKIKVIFLVIYYEKK